MPTNKDLCLKHIPYLKAQIHTTSSIRVKMPSAAIGVSAQYAE